MAEKAITDGNAPTEGMSDQTHPKLEEAQPVTPEVGDFQFELDPSLATLYGAVNESKPAIKESIRRDGRVKEPLKVAVLPGGRRVLYDGYTRLDCWRELRAEGQTIPTPEVEEIEFASMVQVYWAALRIQVGRRNARPF